MGKGLNRVRLQELEEINQCIRANNAGLTRILQVTEKEKPELQDRLQAKDDLLAKLQHGGRMEDKESSTMDAQTQTKVCIKIVSSCSLSS